MSTPAQPAPDRIDSQTPPPGHGPYTGTVADWPLWFVAHDFGVFSYSTYGCKVDYHGLTMMKEPDDVLQISSESVGEKYPDLINASRGPISNFPPPAVVTWRSKDGSAHREEIDIAEIFKDRLIRHHVARDDIREGSSIGPTGIIVEVNDRTINVYTRTFIPLKQPRIAGRPNSNYQDDLIKVFSRTY